MQRTEKYFEPDAFRTQCESVILAAEPDEKTGGGKPGICQGSCAAAPEQVEEFLREQNR